ncbi:MAG: hypothetical protein KY459_15740 [Acidobacteria bacterium]|nr:hypothetical protein [Acidobacteriota bacterium]
MIGSRTIWLWRAIAVVILLIFAILMWNLYARLTRMRPEVSTPTAVEEPAPPSSDQTGR